ncbi:hypothetical protein VNO80_07826 [Phaseolus coccineus]|uniref:Uncharacterized protein n=1 Tax=Phaseolus coccineus TaxID=3886 RepID=A0AAN9NKH2_PHACN
MWLMRILTLLSIIVDGMFRLVLICKGNFLNKNSVFVAYKCIILVLSSFSCHAFTVYLGTQAHFVIDTKLSTSNKTQE